MCIRDSTLGDEAGILVVSFVGYEKVEVTPGKNENVEIALTPESTEMAEVIVTGIAERKAATYTGAVTTFRADDLARIGNQNILQVLKGIDPGFQVLENNDYGSDPVSYTHLILHSLHRRLLSDFQLSY